MRGDRKRKRTVFKLGNIPHNKGVRHLSDNTKPPVSPTTQAASSPVARRMNADTATFRIQKSASGGLQTLAAPDCDGASTSARMLRPRLPVKEKRTEVNDSCGIRMIHIKKNVEMWNDIVYCHHQQETVCDRPDFQIASENKWGLAWKQTVLCSNCTFRSPEYKLYEEIDQNKPGPKAAAMNVMFHAGMQDTPIGISRARYLLAATDIPPPCKTSMNRTANIVGKATIELNERDMANKLQLVHDFNVMHGAEDPRQINVAFDARYNAIHFGHDKKPGHSLSQAVGIACETVTEEQYIVGTSVENKLCWTGAWLKGRHFDVQCPGGHFDCTANLSPVAPHSEYEMAKVIGTKFAPQKILIKHVTTDGDAKAAAGFNDAYSILYPMWEVERLSDPTHLGRSQFKRCNSASFSDTMFPGINTREGRKLKQKILSQDVKARCSLIFKRMMDDTGGDIRSIKSQLPRVLDATMRCYSGDCSKCRWNSKVCGGGDSTSWWIRSAFLGPHQMTHLNMTENDKNLLPEVIKMRLSCDAVHRLRLNTSTQKCEAVNRSISVSLPKNVNYSRNFEARVHSTIHRLNNKLGASLKAKVKHLGGTLSRRMLKSVDQMEKDNSYHRLYQKRPATRRRLLERQGNMIQAHLKYTVQPGNRFRKSDYCKGQLDKTQVSKADHSHAKL